MDDPSTVLQRAFQHIKAGEKQAALDILTPLVQAEPNNAEAWYLLGFALTDPEKRLYAFERVLRLDPKNQPAQQQVAKLRNRPVAESAAALRKKPRRRTSPIIWILTGAGFLLLLLVTILFLLLTYGARLFFQAQVPTVSSPTSTIQVAQKPNAATVPPRPSVTPYPRRATGTPISVVLPTEPHISAPSAPLVEMYNEKDMPNSGQISALTEMKSGHLAAAGTVSLNLDVDSENEISFIVKWTGTQPLSVTLNRPDGQAIDEAYAASYPQEVSFERAETVVYRIAKPSVGVWTINLSASDAGDYGVIGRFTKNPLTLSAESIGFGLAGANIVRLRAKLLNYDVGVVGANAVAFIQYPDGTLSTAHLVSGLTGSGAGEYESEYHVPANQSGAVSVHITLAGSYNDVKYTRSSFFTFMVWDSQTITLTGDYKDSIGKYLGMKAINVEMGIDSTQACTCIVNGSLMAGKVPMGTAFSDNLVLSVGHNRVTISFLTPGILGPLAPFMQIDGPYTLTNLSIQPGRASPASLFATDVWKTQPYHWQELNP